MEAVFLYPLPPAVLSPASRGSVTRRACDLPPNKDLAVVGRACQDASKLGVTPGQRPHGTIVPAEGVDEVVLTLIRTSSRGWIGEEGRAG